MDDLEKSFDSMSIDSIKVPSRPDSQNLTFTQRLERNKQGLRSSNSADSSHSEMMDSPSHKTNSNQLFDSNVFATPSSKAFSFVNQNGTNGTRVFGDQPSVDSNTIFDSPAATSTPFINQKYSKFELSHDSRKDDKQYPFMSLKKDSLTDSKVRIASKPSFTLKSTAEAPEKRASDKIPNFTSPSPLVFGSKPVSQSTPLSVNKTEHCNAHIAMDSKQNFSEKIPLFSIPCDSKTTLPKPDLRFSASPSVQSSSIDTLTDFSYITPVFKKNDDKKEFKPMFSKERSLADNSRNVAQSSYVNNTTNRFNNDSSERKFPDGMSIDSKGTPSQFTIPHADVGKLPLPLSTPNNQSTPFSNNKPSFIKTDDSDSKFIKKDSWLESSIEGTPTPVTKSTSTVDSSATPSFSSEMSSSFFTDKSVFYKTDNSLTDSKQYEPSELSFGHSTFEDLSDEKLSNDTNSRSDLSIKESSRQFSSQSTTKNDERNRKFKKEERADDYDDGEKEKTAHQKSPFDVSTPFNSKESDLLKQKSPFESLHERNGLSTNKKEGNMTDFKFERNDPEFKPKIPASEIGRCERLQPNKGLPSFLLKSKNISIKPAAARNVSGVQREPLSSSQATAPAGMLATNPKDWKSAGPVDVAALKNMSWMEPTSGPAREAGTTTRSEIDGGDATSASTDVTESLKSLFDSLNAVEDDGKGASDEIALTVKNCNLKGLKVSLKAHQVDGVKFLWRRERPSVTNKGGLLCDDMGLGKTIQMLSLILTRQIGDEPKIEPAKDDTLPQIKTTLVVAPLALLQQWAGEVHDKAPSLTCYIHHGTGRATRGSELAKYDIVVTTYSVVASEYADGRCVGPLFNVKFWRVVLDEAHSIKNRKTKSAIAACKLKAPRRWAMTGTPLQNGVDEVQSLLAFANLPPYNNYKVWVEQVGSVIKSRPETALLRLRVVLRGCMLRRKKELVVGLRDELPERRVHRVTLEFSEREREVYRKFEESAKKQLRKWDEQNQSVGYMQAMVLLLRLRQICDHAWLATKTMEKRDIDGELDRAAASVDSWGDESYDDSEEVSRVLEQLKLEDNQRKAQEDSNSKGGTFQTELSSKMLELIRVLENDKTRKTIVFSQFTSFLDLIGVALRRRRILYARYDGSMRPVDREQALADLRDKRGPGRDVGVLLCSLKAGAVGLNLTCASRVVLLDPWWNPMIMEQAIDRVHRIGQQKDVDVYEFVMGKSVEDRILMLQDKKRKLAKAVVEGSSREAAAAQMAGNKLSLGELLQLFEA